MQSHVLRGRFGLDGEGGEVGAVAELDLAGIVDCGLAEYLYLIDGGQF
jgi:hypothetical protein